MVFDRFINQVLLLCCVADKCHSVCENGWDLLKIVLLQEIHCFFLTFFLSAERLSSHMSIHKMYKCAVSQCDKVSFGVYIESFFSLEKVF